MEIHILIYYILFIAVLLVISSFVNSKKVELTDNTAADHDEACCDNYKPCECGMKGKSLFSKIEKDVHAGPYWDKIKQLKRK